MDANAVVGIAGVVVGMVFTYVAFLRGRQKDDKEEGSKDGALLTEIGYIKRMLDEIKDELQEQRKSLNDISIRLAKVEESAKQAHKRIDGLEGKME